MGVGVWPSAVSGYSRVQASGQPGNRIGVGQWPLIRADGHRSVRASEGPGARSVDLWRLGRLMRMRAVLICVRTRLARMGPFPPCTYRARPYTHNDPHAHRDPLTWGNTETRIRILTRIRNAETIVVNAETCIGNLIRTGTAETRIGNLNRIGNAKTNRIGNEPALGF